MKDNILITILSIGAGLFGGFLFPSVDGPFNIFKVLRNEIGKPFTCPLCAGFWSTVIFTSVFHILPVKLSTAIGSAGWVLLLHHISGYNIIYEDMDS